MSDQPLDIARLLSVQPPRWCQLRRHALTFLAAFARNSGTHFVVNVLRSDDATSVILR